MTMQSQAMPAPSQATGAVPEDLRPISIREKVSYGLGDVASCLIYGALGSYMIFFFTDVALIPAAAAGSIVLFSRLLDALSDLGMGVVIDRTNTKYGKCRPWLLWLCVPWGIASVLLFTAPQFSTTGRIIYACLTYNLMTTVIYTGINMPYGALASMITKNQQERAMLSVYRASFGCISVFFVSTFATTFVDLFGGGPDGWQRTFMLFGGVSVLLFLMCFFGTKERVKVVEKKERKLTPMQGIKALFANKYWVIMTTLNIGAASMSTLYGMNTYYARYILQDIGYTRPMMLCATFSLMIVPYLCIPFIKKFGKRDVALYGGMGLALAGQIVLIIFGNTGGMAPIFAGLVMRGFGIAAFTATKFGMITDTIEYGEYKTGLRTEGMINSGAAVGIKLGSAFSSAAIGYILAFYGYDGAAAVQSASALDGIRVLFFWAPLVVIIAMFILLFMYKLDKEYDAVMAELDQRHLRAGEPL